MNQTIDTILNRRSIREYQSKQISPEHLDSILTCADAGPSGANNRQWRLVIVQNQSYKKMLIEKGMPMYQKWLEKMPPHFKEMRSELDKSPDPIYYGAPTIIFVIGKGMTTDMDCPIVCQNIMLSARSLGIGSCWVHIGQLVMGDLSVREEFCLTEGEKVYGPIVLGYPKGNEFPQRPEIAQSPRMWK